MNNDKTETNDENNDIPLFIRGSLIFIAFAINLPKFSNGFSADTLAAFAFSTSGNLIFTPGIFLIVGLLLRFGDDTFKLSNAYYLGVLMAIVLSFQGIKGP